MEFQSYEIEYRGGEAMMIPSPLKKGQKIGIVATAGPIDPDILFRAEAFFKSHGYDTLIAPSCFESHHSYLAGHSDEERALDLKMMFADCEIGAIVCMRGGYGSCRLLPHLKGFDFAKYAKPFVGYSDVTYLHVYLNQVYGLQTCHGPMLKDLLRDDELTNERFWQALIGCVPPLTDIGYWNTSLPNVSGRITGGNLAVICSTLGTGNEIDTRGKILFLEEINEEAYAIDRMLMQLSFAGKLRDCSGIILGDFNVPDIEGVWVTLRQELGDLGKPVAYGVQAGHCVPNITIPLGRMATLVPAKGEIIFT